MKEKEKEWMNEKTSHKEEQQHHLRKRRKEGDFRSLFGNHHGQNSLPFLAERTRVSFRKEQVSVSQVMRPEGATSAAKLTVCCLTSSFCHTSSLSIFISLSLHQPLFHLFPTSSIHKKDEFIHSRKQARRESSVNHWTISDIRGEEWKKLKQKKCHRNLVALTLDIESEVIRNGWSWNFGIFGNARDLGTIVLLLRCDGNGCAGLVFTESSNYTGSVSGIEGEWEEK